MGLLVVLVSQGCHINYQKLGVLNLFFSQFLNFRVQKQVLVGSCSIRRLQRRILPLPLPRFLVAGNPWCFLTYNCITPFSASVFTQSFPICAYLSPNLPLPVKTLVIGFRAHPNSVSLHLNLIISLRPYFYIRSHSHVLRVKILIYVFWWDVVQPTTLAMPL